MNDRPDDFDPMRDSSLSYIDPENPEIHDVDADDYAESFSALGQSITQGFDLMKKRKALSDYSNTLSTLKETYQDRLAIEADYQSIVTEQERLITYLNADYAKTKQKIDEVNESIAAQNERLTQLRREQDNARRDLEKDLAIANNALASVKDEYRQVKSQRDSLDLFEKDPDGNTASEEVHDQVIDHVNEKLENAKASQRAAQSALDEREKQDRSQQRKITDAIKQLERKKNEFEEQLSEIDKQILHAKDRIAYCDHVISHPEETVEMRTRIEENTRTAAQMESQINDLAATHEKTKKRSSTARTVLFIVGGVAIVLIILLSFLFK